MDIEIGSVFRQCYADGSSHAFSDAAVVKIYVVKGETYCNLARPYVLTNVDSGVESIDHVPVKSLGTTFWRMVKR